MSEIFRRLTSVAAPLLRSNVDTDIIIPMSRLVMAEKADMHLYAFEPLRFLAGGSENPDFVLNQDAYRDAAILITGPNFGCGSSREGAVWAIRGLGIRCLIGSSFGNIFYNNCFQNGILPVVLPAETVERLAALAEDGNGGPFEVDLETCRITSPDGETYEIEIDAGHRRQLLEGLDDIGLTLERSGEIDAFRAADRERRPWIYLD